MLLRGGQSRPVQSGRGQRNRKKSDCRAVTKFQASHRSWNLKNFKQRESNLRISLRISWKDLGIFPVYSLQKCDLLKYHVYFDLC